jgi:glycosyltransferase involved in cell wall biosynthesis
VSGRLRIAVYDLYWSTLGGGEQVDGSIAQALASDHDVTLLGPAPVDVEATRARLGVDLSSCSYRPIADDIEAGEASADYDVFVNGTYLSSAVNRAGIGYYYVHFPRPPRTRRDLARHYAGVAGVRLLSTPPSLPHRLGRIQAAFDRRVDRVEFVGTYRRFLANSAFTASWTQRLWGVPAEVLHPPVRATVTPGEKRPLILVLGRFFDPSYGHSKKQMELLDTFARLHRSGRLPGWELAIVGGCDAANRDFALAIKRAALGLPVTVHVNAPGEVVERLLGEASLYWHAAGYGEDEQRHPQRFEHFGIAVVEAMAAGAVPLVHGRAGPIEIVRPGIDGEHWETLDELAARTLELADDEEQRTALAACAIERAGTYSAARFERSVRQIVAGDAGAQGGQQACDDVDEADRLTRSSQVT